MFRLCSAVSVEQIFYYKLFFSMDVFSNCMLHSTRTFFVNNVFSVFEKSWTCKTRWTTIPKNFIYLLKRLHKCNYITKLIKSLFESQFSIDAHSSLWPLSCFQIIIIFNQLITQVYKFLLLGSCIESKFVSCQDFEIYEVMYTKKMFGFFWGYVQKVQHFLKLFI